MGKRDKIYKCYNVTYSLLSGKCGFLVMLNKNLWYVLKSDKKQIISGFSNTNSVCLIQSISQFDLMNFSKQIDIWACEAVIFRSSSI